MATKSVTVRKNADNTLTVRVGRAVEYIGLESKSRNDIFEAIKWAAISKDVYLTDIDLIELMREVDPT